MNLKSVILLIFIAGWSKRKNLNIGRIIKEVEVTPLLIRINIGHWIKIKSKVRMGTNNYFWSQFISPYYRLNLKILYEKRKKYMGKTI
jgi:hypothetical protein